jgi:hypothetical protein
MIAFTTTILTSLFSNASVLNLTKLCGTSVMDPATVTGLLTLEGDTVGDRGRLDVKVFPTQLNIAYDVIISKVTPTVLPRNKNEEDAIISYMSSMGITDPKVGTIYELKALDLNGQLLKSILFSKDSNPTDNLIVTSVFSYGTGKTAIMISVNLGSSGFFNVATATNDCK